MATSIEEIALSLAEREVIIERGLATFIEVGSALADIRDERQYLEAGYSSFEAYCNQRWGINRGHANRLIMAASVAAVLDPIGSMPAREAVARELTPLRDDPDAMREAWRVAQEQHGPDPTAAQVHAIVAPLIAPEKAPMAIHYSSATDEWSTPADLFGVLNDEFGFTLDVCASPLNAKCDRFFDRSQDGLSQPWEGVCFCNPPYGDGIGAWVGKARESAAQGATVVCLVPGRIDTGWFWDHCRYGEVRILRGRLRFGGQATDAGAPFPSVVVVFEPDRAPDVIWWEWKEAQ